MRPSEPSRTLDRVKSIPDNVAWWAFRIDVTKAGRPLDVDNVAKTIIDAFCSWQISRDGSPHVGLGLYPDDTFNYVRVLQVIGSPGEIDRTRIEILACLK